MSGRQPSSGGVTTTGLSSVPGLERLIGAGTAPVCDGDACSVPGTLDAADGQIADAG